MNLSVASGGQIRIVHDWKAQIDTFSLLICVVPSPIYIARRDVNVNLVNYCLVKDDNMSINLVQWCLVVLYEYKAQVPRNAQVSQI